VKEMNELQVDLRGYLARDVMKWKTSGNEWVWADTGAETGFEAMVHAFPKPEHKKKWEPDFNVEHSLMCLRVIRQVTALEFTSDIARVTLWAKDEKGKAVEIVQVAYSIEIAGHYARAFSRALRVAVPRLKPTECGNLTVMEKPVLPERQSDPQSRFKLNQMRREKLVHDHVAPDAKRAKTDK